MRHPFAFLLAGTLALVACQSDDFQALQAKIAAKAGTPTDSSGHYLVDFGQVGVGTVAIQTLTITDLGRAALSVPVFPVTAPFGTQITAQLSVSQNAMVPLPFSFSPTAIGPASETVIIKSNGGSVTVDLEGVGVTAPPACTFSVVPTSIDFGSVAAGQTQTSGVHITNTGTSDCDLSDVQIAASSDPVFTLAPGQPTTATLPAGAGGTLNVVYAPTAPGTFTGTLTLLMSSPSTPVSVPLNATSPEYPDAGNVDAGPMDAGTFDAGPQNCVLAIAPTSLAFGNLQLGQTKTLSFTLKNAGTVECDVSGITLDPSSNAAFALVAGQATSGMLAHLATLAVSVVFTPTVPGLSFTGKVNLTEGPPGSAASVPLTAESTACADPNANGTCPVAMAPIYLNDDVALYSYTPSTNVATLIAPFSAPGVSFAMYDIGIDQQGTMYGVSENVLYTINPTNAACLKVGTLTDSPNGMTVLANGDIVVAGDDVEIIDGITYALKQTLVSAFQYNTSGDIVYLPDGNLYWTVDGSGANDELVRLNPTSGATTVVGTMSTSGVWGLAYYDGVLYGFTSDGKYLVINPATAATTSSGSVAGSWYGATTNPAAP